MSFWRNILTVMTATTAAALLPGGVRAQTITNVASADWTAPGGGTRTVRSNPVDITLVAPPTSGIIYRIDSPGTGTLSRIDGSGCTSGNAIGGLAGGDTTSGGTSQAPTQVSLSQAEDFTAGQPIAFGINSPADNRDPTARDSFDVTVRTGNGDLETVRLREDAVNSGFFVGYIATLRIPPALVQGDCRLSVAAGSPLDVNLYRIGSNTSIARAQISFLVDPFGIVFDSGDGAPVRGARVTLINVATGQPALVFGDDGVSSFPSSIVTGSTVTDGGGQVYAFPTGDYRFPFVAPGSYRLLVEPPEPYTWHSNATVEELAPFRRPDNGEPYTLGTASYGAVFQLFAPTPVRIDIPVDRPNAGIQLTKTSSSITATPGSTIQYRIAIRNADATRTTGVLTVTDDMPRDVRLRPTSVRYNGAPVTASISPDGRHFTVGLPPLAGGATGLLTYLAEIRPDSQPGDATNIAIARDNRGSVSNTADSTVRITRDVVGDRITIIGRVTDGGCSTDPDAARGIQGVRVMLQDGSFAVTDSDGRYHFEGVRPGLHVVQIDPSSLPGSVVPINCAANNRAAGSAISRFVEGRGGELKRADFHAVSIASPEAPADAESHAVPVVAAPARPATVADVTAAGGDRDFFANQTAGIDWLFPEPDHNPRSPSVRIAIKHLPGQRVELSVNGRPVDGLSFDGANPSPDRSFIVSVWSGVEISDRDNLMVARVLDESGALVQELTRTVHYANSPMNVSLVRERSLLVADGLNRPVIAVRLTDRDGRPVKQGLVGDFTVASPHRAAIESDAEQERQLSGLDRGRATWRIPGDDGIAYIELDPTTASGTARLNFTFRDQQVTREQQLDVWLNPGDRPWTIVGFAAGTIGYNTLDDRMEPVAETLPSDNVDGRVALYANGRILGQWLMTMSYDSDKEQEEARFGGVIDPRAYYTIYADRADNGFDAASVRNLYLRLERPQFYALFGDFETAINEPQLTRYQRSMNGVRAEYRGTNLAATAFVADTPYRYRRDEMQGNGLSGPYQLSTRDILANSERVSIEIRDRTRSDLIVETRQLTRHIDYDIDYFAGTLTFREPVLSRDPALNPQFIVVDYETRGVGQRVVNGGGRVSWTSNDESLRVGLTGIHDASDTASANLGGVDVRYRPTASVEVRAEYAVSDSDSKKAGVADVGTASAWLVEVEHHGSVFDILAYARERESGFGVGQLSNAGQASRRIGLDGSMRLGTGFSLIASAWQEDYLDTDARRRAGRLLGEWRGETTTLRAGLTRAEDTLATGEQNISTLVQLGATQRLLNQRLELDAQTEFALGGQDDSVDFPTRHTFGARYAVTQGITLVGAYEIASGGTVDARTVRAGFDVRPWDGGRVNLTGNKQDIGEFGPRSFAAYGLSQSFTVSENLSLDMTVDGQRTLGGINARDVLDLAHPVASGGQLDGSGAITEDFIAVTGGATWRNEDWNITGRAEYRDGELTDRYGATLGGIRQIGEGRALGGLFSYTRASSETGLASRTMSAELSWAHRPADSRWSFLEKLEFRSDELSNAIAGQSGPIGGPALTVSGDVSSRRVINSLTVNYTPVDEDDGLWHEAGEYTLFWGARYTDDRFGDEDVSGWSTVVGLDLRFDLSEHVGVGVTGNARIGTDGDAKAFSAGPQIVVTPFENANIVIGYNVAGFRDRDFEESRYTRQGLFATFRLKFDQTTFEGLGLLRR